MLSPNYHESLPTHDHHHHTILTSIRKILSDISQPIPRYSNWQNFSPNSDIFYTSPHQGSLHHNRILYSTQCCLISLPPSNNDLRRLYIVLVRSNSGLVRNNFRRIRHWILHVVLDGWFELRHSVWWLLPIFEVFIWLRRDRGWRSWVLRCVFGRLGGMILGRISRRVDSILRIRCIVCWTTKMTHRKDTNSRTTTY